MTQRKKVKTAKQRKRQKPLSSQSELARALGVSRQLINYHVRKGGAPNLSDVEAWREFLTAEGRDGIAALPEDLKREIGDARRRLISAQAAKEETRLAAMQRKLISREDVARKLFAVAQEQRQILEESSVPPELVDAICEKMTTYAEGWK